MCWLYGKYLYKQLQYPIGLITTSWNATSIDAWSSQDVINACQPSLDSTTATVHLPQNSPTYLWNAMVHPFLNLTIYGAIWYQGKNVINIISSNIKCPLTNYTHSVLHRHTFMLINSSLSFSGACCFTTYRARVE